MTIRDDLFTLLTETYGLPSDALTDDAALFSTGQLDSFVLVELIDFVEQRYAIKVRPSDVRLDNFDAIATIVTYVQSRT